MLRGNAYNVSNIGDGAQVIVGEQNVLSTVTYGSGLANVLAVWRSVMDREIQSHQQLTEEEKITARRHVSRIEEDIAKAEDAKSSRLEKKINDLCAISSDIFNVAVATLANPLAGIGLVIRKINDKATIPRSEAAAPAGKVG